MPVNERLKAGNDGESAKDGQEVEQRRRLLLLVVVTRDEHLEEGDVDERADGQSLKYGHRDAAAIDQRRVDGCRHCGAHGDADRTHETEGEHARRVESQVTIHLDEFDADAEGHDELVQRDGDEGHPDAGHVRLKTDGHALEDRMEREADDEHHTAQRASQLTMTVAPLGLDCRAVDDRCRLPDRLSLFVDEQRTPFTCLLLVIVPVTVVGDRMRLSMGTVVTV